MPVHIATCRNWVQGRKLTIMADIGRQSADRPYSQAPKCCSKSGDVSLCRPLSRVFAHPLSTARSVHRPLLPVRVRLQLAAVRDLGCRSGLVQCWGAGVGTVCCGGAVATVLAVGRWARAGTLLMRTCHCQVPASYCHDQLGYDVAELPSCGAE